MLEKEMNGFMNLEDDELFYVNGGSAPWRQDSEGGGYELGVPSTTGTNGESKNNTPWLVGVTTGSGSSSSGSSKGIA